MHAFNVSKDTVDQFTSRWFCRPRKAQVRATEPLRRAVLVKAGHSVFLRKFGS